MGARQIFYAGVGAVRDGDLLRFVSAGPEMMWGRGMLEIVKARLLALSDMGPSGR
jgi:hypothetical protein